MRSRKLPYKICCVCMAFIGLFAFVGCSDPITDAKPSGGDTSIDVPEERPDGGEKPPAPDTGTAFTGTVSVYPVPKQITQGEQKKFMFDGKFSCDEHIEENAKNKLKSVLGEYATLSESTAEDASVSFKQDLSLGKSGYALVSDGSGVRVTYRDSEGAYYAAVTLSQLLRQGSGGVPYVTVEDCPDTDMRGFHISSQNKIGKVEFYKALIDDMAALKMNCLELAVFRPSSIQIDTFSAVTEYETGLTVDECREIAAYGRANYVSVVPYIETFGHLDELLRYPQFVDLRNTFTAGCATLSIYDPKAHEFLQSYMDDIMEAFDHPPFVCIGGDEVSGILDGENKKNAPEGAEPLDVFIYYMQLVYGLCEKADAEMYICYDMIDNLYAQGRTKLKNAFEAMPNTTVIIWQYEEDSTFTAACDRFEKLGAKYVIMPSTDTFGSCAGRLTTAEINISTGAKTAIERGTGVITAMFGDGGTRNTWTAEYTELTYAAGCCWNYGGNANKKTEYLAYCNEYFIGEESGELIKAWESLQRHNDLLGRSWGLGWLGGIGNATRASNSTFETFVDIRVGGQFARYAEIMDTIVGRAQKVLDVLDGAEIKGAKSEQIRGEMTITARQMIVLAEYAKMLLELRGELKTEFELKQRAAEMYAYALENERIFREVWSITNKKGVIEDTVAWLNIPMSMFGEIGDVYSAPSDNLFLITPDSLADSSGKIDESLFTKGYNWMGYGKHRPAVSVSNGIYSYNDVAAMIGDGSITLTDMTGADGKVFGVNAAKLLEKGHCNFYYADASKNSFLRAMYVFPCVMNGNGTYRLTAKVKYESGRDVSGNITVSGIATVGGLRSFTGISVSCSEPDANGWVTVTATYENTEAYKYASFGINAAEKVKDDTLYLGELKLVKAA